MRNWGICAIAGVVLAACGVKSDKEKCLVDPLSCIDGSVGDDPRQGALGKPCTTREQCENALRLSCVEGMCAFTGDLAKNDPCSATLECGEGLYCSIEDGRHVCDSAGTGGAGARCESTADCERNLVCAFDNGLAKHCVAAGEGDIGTGCGGPSDCLAGLYCTPPIEDRERVCAALNPGDSTFVPWDSLACPDEDSAAVAYFRVPRKDGQDGDFFRLPFPNDVRRSGAKLDLEGFPSPGDLFGVGIDFVGNYVKAAEQRQGGFATNPVVYFRFSRPYVGVAAESVMLLDIDPDSPDYGKPLSRSWGTSAGEVTRYVCKNWLNVRTPVGAPLRPGTTYAMVLTTGIKAKDGSTFKRAADFEALLQADAPADAVLRAAHIAYAPLRAFLADPDNERVKAADVLNAAVFTTVDTLGTLDAARRVVLAEPAPALKSVTVCKAGTKSPCDDGAERVCATNADYTEVHGKVALPIFQAGDPPYESAGGGFEMVGGMPKIQRHEDVCFGLALPKGAAPEGGMPLVIYAHGTGGSFKTGLADLGKLAAEHGAAVLTIDLPQHGARRHSMRPPDELFYNFTNPDAARDNVSQGSVDLFSLVWLAKNLDAGADSAFGQAVSFSRIVLFGHSQGATHAALAAPLENDVSGVVLSGVGGDVSESLVAKRAPIDLASTLYVLLGDTAAAPEGALCPPILGDDGKPVMTSDGSIAHHQCIGSSHPVYALLQGFLERSDPVNFASLLAKPGTGRTAKHVFMTFGIGDTYAPDITQKAFAAAGALTHVAPELLAITPDGVKPAPLSANVTVGMAKFTQGVRQYMAEEGKDAHFVYQGPARADWQRFLGALLDGQLPAIGE
jgi:pimeloyl-ACP methyl ester carboxylesterase